MVGGMGQEGLASRTTGGGILLGTGSTTVAQGLLITGFAEGAIIARDNSASLFAYGTSRIVNTFVSDNPALTALSQIKGGVVATVEYLDMAPLLANARYEPNPDPWPNLGSLALAVASVATPPTDGVTDTSTRCIDAFCDGNWIEK